MVSSVDIILMKKSGGKQVVTLHTSALSQFRRAWKTAWMSNIPVRIDVHTADGRSLFGGHSHELRNAYYSTYQVKTR